jgi:hypothetical protein
MLSSPDDQFLRYERFQFRSVLYPARVIHGLSTSRSPATSDERIPRETLMHLPAVEVWTSLDFSDILASLCRHSTSS